MHIQNSKFASYNRVSTPSLLTDRAKVKPVIVTNRSQANLINNHTRNKKEPEITNKSYNIGNNYISEFNKILDNLNKNLKNDKSVDNITKSKYNNPQINKIDNIKTDNSSFSYRHNSVLNKRPRSTNPDYTSKSKYIHNNTNTNNNISSIVEKTKSTSGYRANTQPKIENKGFVFDSNTLNSTKNNPLIDISNSNISPINKSFINKTDKSYINKTDNSFLNKTNNSYLNKTDNSYLNKIDNNYLTKTDNSNYLNKIDNNYLTKTDNSSYLNKLDNYLTKTDNKTKNSYMNRTYQATKKDLPSTKSQIDINDNTYKYINTFNKSSNLIRNQSSNNVNIPTLTDIIKKNDIEILGKINNERKTYRFIDHRHPNTLYEANCHYCDNMVKDNKLYLTNIKDESINGNHSFYATFGPSPIKNK